jgi:hypothetical protein
MTFLDVSNVPGAPIGSEVNTIDGRRYRVAEEVGEVFARLEEESDGTDQWDELGS